MTARARADERGEVGITSLLVGAVVLVIVLGSSLATFESFTRTSRTVTDRTDAQDKARTAADTMARQLRNLASPVPEQPQAVDLAGPYDLVFKTVDDGIAPAGFNGTRTKRVRWCLDAGTPSNAQLVAQEQTWTSATPPAAPATSGCPAAGWTKTTVVATRLVNRANSIDRPVFTYDTSVLPDISAIHVDLAVDEDVTRAPAETQIATGVFLRNQNRRPVASFTATPTAQGIVLNGSSSTDPEGEPLTYQWFDGATQVATGIIASYKVTAGTTHAMRLRVLDPAGLVGDANAVTVTA
jgi:type II secretory pathway component PulJ